MPCFERAGAGARGYTWSHRWIWLKSSRSPRPGRSDVTEDIPTETERDGRKKTPFLNKISGNLSVFLERASSAQNAIAFILE